MDDLELARRFTAHRRRLTEPGTLEELSAKGLELARLINSRCRNSPEKTIAVDRLEEAVLWAAAAASTDPGCGPDCPAHGELTGVRSAG